MVKMDSWMKEAQRFNPLLLITFERVVHRPFTLSSGLIIPAHTTIGIPTQAITMDPALYPDPETYEPASCAHPRPARSMSFPQATLPPNLS
jgi:ent-kaurene oxidase